MVDNGRILRDEESADMLPIWVGKAEASAISLGSLKAGAKGLRIGIPQQAFFDNLDPEVEKAVRTKACACSSTTEISRFHMTW